MIVHHHNKINDLFFIPENEYEKKFMQSLDEKDFTKNKGSLEVTNDCKKVNYSTHHCKHAT